MNESELATEKRARIDAVLLDIDRVMTDDVRDAITDELTEMYGDPVMPA